MLVEKPSLPNAADKLRSRLYGGLIPAVPVPLDESGRLHTDGHEAYLRYIRLQPVRGVAVWAHTGRGLLLDEDTARVVLRDWRAALEDRVLIAGAGASHLCTPEEAGRYSVTMGERAARGGADALLVYPPTWVRGQAHMDKQIVEHHKQLAVFGLPLVLFYLYETAGGISYSRAVLDDLLALPSVVGIKMATLDSVMTYQDIARHVTTRHPDKLLITGEDRFLGYSLRLGASAALIGMGAVCCKIQTDLITCHLRGDAEAFLALSDLIDALAETIFIAPMEGYIKRLLWALVHLRVIPAAAAHDPWGCDIPASQFHGVGRAVAALKDITD